jgi:hypothetical protein
MATLMHENGADIRHIQAMLGHARLESTQVYTQVSVRQLKRIHEATHPARPRRLAPQDLGLTNGSETEAKSAGEGQTGDQTDGKPAGEDHTKAEGHTDVKPDGKPAGERQTEGQVDERARGNTDAQRPAADD